MRIVKPLRGTRFNRAHPLSRGLISGWLMNEMVGNHMHDFTESGNNIVKNTSAQWKVGPSGESSGFYQDANYSSITGKEVYPENITIEAWARYELASEVGTNRQNIIGNYIGSSSQWRYTLGCNGAGSSKEIGCWVRIGGTDYNTEGSGFMFQTDTLVHLVSSYDGANLKGYINGELGATIAVTGSINQTVGADTYFGRSAWSVDRVWPGWIYVLRIWDRGLNQNEVKELYCEPFGMFDQSLGIWALSAPTSLAGNPIYYNMQQSM